MPIQISCNYYHSGKYNYSDPVWSLFWTKSLKSKPFNTNNFFVGEHWTGKIILMCQYFFIYDR